MKRTILCLAIFSLFLACNQKGGDNTGFTLDGTISGFDSAYVQLKKVVDGDLKTIDSMLVTQGKFNFKGSTAMPEMYYLVFGGDKPVKIFIENAAITFKANIDSLDAAVITGSKSQDDFKSYMDEIHPFENKMSDLSQQYNAAEDQKNQVLMNQIDSTYSALEKDMNNFMRNYIGTHKSSSAVPYILSRIAYSLNVKELDSMVNLLDKKLDSSVYTIALKERVQILKNVEVGKPAPDFTLNDTTGKPVSMFSFKGKYLLIDFWASWCSPCRHENPNSVKLYKEFNKKGLEILGVSLDEKRKDWVAAIKSDKLTWTNVSDLKGGQSVAGKLYGVELIPHTVLVDKEGVIIATDLRGDELFAKVKELLK